MDKRVLVATVGALLATPAISDPVRLRRQDDDTVPTMLFKKEPPRGRLRVIRTHDVSKLQLRAYRKAEIRRDPPEGYFWHQSANGSDKWYLLKLPPGEGRKVYDEAFDRTILFSGWGYAKPTYQAGDAR
jgi:hypothetical protein